MLIHRVLSSLTRDGKIFLSATLIGIVLVVVGITCFILVNARVGGALLAPGLVMTLICGLVFLLDTSMVK